MVLTHHCPVIENSSATNYSSPIWNPMMWAFSNNLNWLFKNFMKPDNSNVLYWCFGHTHYNGANGKIVNGTMLLTNQAGKKSIYVNMCVFTYIIGYAHNRCDGFDAKERRFMSFERENFESSENLKEEFEVWDPK